MGDWLRLYNVAEVVQFIEVFRIITGQYYPDQIYVYKGAFSIPGISMTHELNKSLEKNKKSLSYIHHGAFAIYVEIYDKSSSTAVVLVPWNVVLIVKNVS